MTGDILFSLGKVINSEYDKGIEISSYYNSVYLYRPMYFQGPGMVSEQYF